VEHPVLASDIRPWRTAAVVASAVAVVELLALLVIGLAMLAKPVAAEVKRQAAARAFAPAPVAKRRPKPKPVAAPRLARSDTAVLVLNGNGRNGAAALEADRVRVKGYRIAAVADAPRRDYARTLVMFRAGFAGEAHRLARDLRIAIVGPLDGVRTGSLQGAHAIIVVGAR
jgi:LytR cell envelope-related transcriptional attenuator